MSNGDGQQARLSPGRCAVGLGCPIIQTAQRSGSYPPTLAVPPYYLALRNMAIAEPTTRSPKTSKKIAAGPAYPSLPAFIGAGKRRPPSGVSGSHSSVLTCWFAAVDRWGGGWRGTVDLCGIATCAVTAVHTALTTRC